jgi:hypothetical protein
LKSKLLGPEQIDRKKQKSLKIHGAYKHHFIGKVTAENNGTMTKQKVDRSQEKQSKETVAS